MLLLDRGARTGDLALRFGGVAIACVSFVSA